VHGEALLEDADPNAPNCARCHGVHGASPPGFGDVAKVCGQCHASARLFFERSVHKEAMDAAGLPECASCHGNHAIGPAGSELAGEVCQEWRSSRRRSMKLKVPMV
jgi:cytochrome c553